ncbi:MAG: response regulator transcription factor [Actinomycetota bacterium]
MPTLHVTAAIMTWSRGRLALAKVLVVDDDRVIQQLLEVNLELEGYDVKRASNGDEALKLVRTFAPDVVLLDVMMPKLDGREVCRRIKGDDTTAHIPVIFLSARAQDMDVNSGLELGASAYITKPFDPVDLLETVERVLAGETVFPPG